MTTAKSHNYLSGFGLSFLTTSIVSALLVIAKEENAALKNWMKALLGHHWVTHGAFILVLFLILGFVFSGIHGEKEWTEKKLITVILIGTILGGLLLGGFFLFE